MPKVIDGKKLSAREHDQWRVVHQQTGSGAKATAAVKRSREGRKEKREK